MATMAGVADVDSNKNTNKGSNKLRANIQNDNEASLLEENLSVGALLMEEDVVEIPSSTSGTLLTATGEGALGVTADSSTYC